MEGLVIVVSILLAFAVDSAGERWKESQRRAALLDALRSDTEAAELEIARVVRVHNEGRDAAATLLDLGPRAPLGPEEARLVDSLLTAVIQSPTYDAPMGAVEALLASGELELLDDTQLTLSLTSFPALVADLDREQGLLVGVVSELTDYLRSQRVDASHLNVGTTVPWDIAPTSAFRLVDDPAFRSVLNRLYFRYRNTSVDLVELEQATTTIRAHLKTQ